MFENNQINTKRQVKNEIINTGLPTLIDPKTELSLTFSSSIQNVNFKAVLFESFFYYVFFMDA